MRIDCLALLVVLLTTIGAVAASSHQVDPRGRAPSLRTSSSSQYRRQLQQDALSNSNGCITSGAIPKCEPGACASRNVKGLATWVCLRCLANFEPVVDDSGQDNILQCVCPAGFFEAAPNATRCSRCSANSWCPGGDKSVNAISRGQISSCGTGLVTRNTGARSLVDCVAPAGYAKTGSNVGTPCDVSTYAPQYNRLNKCLRCQSGLQEPPGSGLLDGQRDSKRTVCKVPPGKFISQGLVRFCPQGFYRERYLDFDNANATLCRPCNRGITTEGAGATLASMCNRVLSGYGISNVFNVTGPQNAPLYPQADLTGLPQALVCDIGFYSLNGFCASCPAGTVTRNRGATTIEECVVPPGYYISPEQSTMVLCPAATFRAGWLMHSDPSATNCTSCGDGISSDARQLDENPLAANGSLVRATSDACFIDAGMGMLAGGRNIFSAIGCPINTYGAADRTYGWVASPCKPCPRNMITDGLVRQSSSEACVNPDGYGYASEGANRCAPGFWATKGSRQPCQQCAVCRTTLDNPAFQRTATNCVLKPGCGVVDSRKNSTDAFNIDTASLTDAQLVLLPALECRVGWWGPGNSTGSKCTACPFGSTTTEPGRTSVSECNVCIAGYGLATPTATSCTICPFGSWQPGGLTQCIPCDNSTFYPPVDGLGPTWTSAGTTPFRGAWGVESCVPVQSQLSPEAGQAYFSRESAMQPLLQRSNATTLADCLAACGLGTCCISQWDATASTCQSITLAPASADAASGLQVQYKLPPSTLTSASSLKDKAKAKMMASGYYALCAVPAPSAAAWLTAGSNLTPDARTFSGAAALWLNGSASGAAACRQSCDGSNVCWGFVYDAATRSCLFRGGVDAIMTRSFFTLPGTADGSGWGSATNSSGSSSGSGGNQGQGPLPDQAPLPGASTGCSSGPFGTNPCAQVANSNGTCSAAATALGYSCACISTGFSWNATAGTCTDVNECASGNGGCSHTCTNTAGSFTCSCPTGYNLSSNGRTCNDVNECASGNGGCSQICTNTIGGFTCSCSAYFTLATNGRNCTSCGTLFIKDIVRDGGFGTNWAGAHPQGMIVDSAGNFYWAAYDKDCVMRWNSSSRTSSEFAGTCGAGNQYWLNKPSDIALTSQGHLYIADTENNRLRVRLAWAASATDLATVTITGLPSPSALSKPTGLAIHPTTGALFLADSNNKRVLSITLTTPTSGVAQVVVPATADIQAMQGITFSPSGNLVIAADNDKKVWMLRASDNTLVRLAGGGTGGNIGYNNNGDGGPATNSVLQGAKDVAYAADGALLITGGNSIRRVDPSTGIISTLVGPLATNSSSVPAPDGFPATATTLSNVWGVTMDAAGTIYFVERDAPALRRLSCTP